MKKNLSEHSSVLVEGWGVTGQCGRHFVLFFCNQWMGGNIGKAIASMILEQSYERACAYVC